MGFLSSLFGSGDSRPATSTNIVSQKLPTEIAPYISQILKEGSAQFEAEKAAGYQPYTGDTTARLTAQQEAALTGLEGLAGTQQPFLDEAGQIIRQGADQFTGDVAQQYMSPYQQAVTDIELREAGRRFEGTTMPKLEAQAVNMGAMSGLGSRAGVEMAEAQRSQNQLLADIQAKGQQKAYESARQEYGFQKAREGQMAENVAQLGGREVAAGLTELGALKSAGEERQGLAQSALDEAYLKYQQEQQFPKQNLAEFSQLVYGNPLVNMPTTSRSGTDTPYQHSTGQTLLGMGLGAANIYGMGGGFGGNFSTGQAANAIFGGKLRAEGGPVGGGLDSLPVVRRAVNGPAGPQSSPGLGFSFEGGFEEDDPTEKLRKQLLDPNLKPEERDKLIRRAALGSTLPTGLSASEVAAKNKISQEELSRINTNAANAMKKQNQSGLSGMKKTINNAATERRDTLDNTLDNKRADLIKGMQARGASRKEIQDALNAMPKRGPGLSTKTGSAQGIGKDITNILDTLRTDVNKQQSLDDTRKRADILALGGMKRADTEKQIAGESDITTTEGTGKTVNINKEEAGNLSIGKAEADNIKSQITKKQESQLKEFAFKETGIKKIEAIPEKLLKQVQDIFKLKLLEDTEKNKRLAAKAKLKPKDASVTSMLKHVNANILSGTDYILGEDGSITQNGAKLEENDAKEVRKLITEETANFMKLVADGESTNTAYNKAYLEWLDGLKTRAGKGTSKTSMPPVSQRKAGQVYPTPKGKMKWTGTGWVQP